MVPLLSTDIIQRAKDKISLHERVRLAVFQYLFQGMRSTGGGHWSTESWLPPSWSSSLTAILANGLRGDYKDEARVLIAKTLKGLKTTNSGRDTRGRAGLEPLFMNLVRRKRLPRADLCSENGEVDTETGTNAGRSTDFKSIRKPDKIFYGERALMALTMEGPPRPHWFVVTEDDRPYRLPPCPSSEPIRFERLRYREPRLRYLSSANHQRLENFENSSNRCIEGNTTERRLIRRIVFEARIVAHARMWYLPIKVPFTKS